MVARECRNERISRVIDVLIAGLALAVLSPVMLLIAAVIVAETGRPVFYIQTRFAQGGKTFRIYKFRKFRACEDIPGPLLTIRNDARMSWIGSLLERTKLDELPQFYNVLRGDMAIVGPRPDSAVASDCFTGEFRALLDYKPGLFGPAQVAFRNAGTLYPPYVDREVFYREVIFPLKAALDLAYYPRRTVLKDLGWIIRGILAVFGLHPTMRELPGAPPTAWSEGPRAARRTARALDAKANFSAPDRAATESWVE
jgi:lipopolysaccharide/colanic/teichoic acid biosynthesis glycosyltransferase